MNLTPEKKWAVKSALIYSLIIFGIMIPFVVLCVMADCEITLFDSGLIFVISDLFGKKAASFIDAILVMIAWYGYIPASIIQIVIWFFKLKKAQTKGTFILMTYVLNIILLPLCIILGIVMVTRASGFGFSMFFLTIEYLGYLLVYTVITIICALRKSSKIPKGGLSNESNA